MPNTVHAQQVVNDGGVAPVDVHAAVTATNETANGGSVVLHIRAAAGGAVNLTLVNQTSQDGLAGPNKVVNIPANAERIIGPIPSGIYNQANGTVQFNVDTPANVAFLAIYALGR